MKKTTLHSDVVDMLTLEDLCRFCDADEAWVIELVEHGVLDPIGGTSSNWRFFGASIRRAKKARRLNRDLGVNTAGVALVLDLLDERDAVVRRLAQYEAP
ncbi:chaperone modulator CbpM [Sulfitobacter aestuariivivens]|uniref:Chaperone modulator CbpM n=1 Tax=Sulfitobacter aestuariivivens TaxID=2766981 RepID=A0A927D9X0_9RHOB|nr:chaperone modulator CbpM [Sulfitobacter aestuariivivens]MBD3665401.1 chaperone modulator CbpM [Sulfitobacter aestuariivivens]